MAKRIVEANGVELCTLTPGDRLLGQPRGCDGRRSVFSEVRPLDGLTVSERPHVPHVSLNIGAARLPPAACPDESKHLVPCVDQLFRLPAGMAAFPGLRHLAFRPRTRLLATAQNHRVYE